MPLLGRPAWTGTPPLRHVIKESRNNEVPGGPDRTGGGDSGSRVGHAMKCRGEVPGSSCNPRAQPRQWKADALGVCRFHPEVPAPVPERWGAGRTVSCPAVLNGRAGNEKPPNGAACERPAAATAQPGADPQEPSGGLRRALRCRSCDRCRPEAHAGRDGLMATTTGSSANGPVGEADPAALALRGAEEDARGGRAWRPTARPAPKRHSANGAPVLIRRILGGLFARTASWPGEQSRSGWMRMSLP